jgi:hypothetical protein
MSDGLPLSPVARPRWRPSLYTAIASVAAVILWVVSVHGAHFDRMGALGLASILGWPYFVGLAIVVTGFAWAIKERCPRSIDATLLVIILILYLFGTAPAIEPVAALPDSWLHASFVSYVLDHGQALNNYDARFSWPGFFGLAAVTTKGAGWANVVGFLRWFPLFIEVLYLAPLRVIASRSDVTPQAAWMGVGLFYSADWIYQDYFSPQALNVLFYLVVIATVMALFEPRAQLIRRARAGWMNRLTQVASSLRWRRLLGHDSVMAESPSFTMLGIGASGAITLASAISHQLTPFALILALGALLLTRRLQRPEILVAASLFAVGWLSLGASNFWMGHLSTIFGGIGQVGSSIGANVTSRVVGSASHLFVVHLRIIIVAAVFAVAALGVLRRAAKTRTLEALAAVPFVLIVLQSYGGEGLMRAVLFSLPFTAILAGCAVWPSIDGQIRPLIPWRPRALASLAPALALLIILIFSVATTVARGGNDAFEAFAPGEVKAVNFIAQRITPGQTVGAAIFYSPASAGPFEHSYSYFAATKGDPSVTTIGRRLVAAAPQWVELGKSQEEWGEVVAGYPKGWTAEVTSVLLANGYTVAHRWSDAIVLRRTSSAGGA